MSPRLPFCSLVLASLVVAAPLAQVTRLPIATAQAVSPAKKKLAKQYVQAGLAAQEAKDYDAALVFYGKAYEAVPHPILIFNMAQAQRLAGRLTEALKLYEQYLDLDPKGPQAQTARELVTALKAQLAAQEQQRIEAEAKARQAEEMRAAEESRKAEEMRAAEEVLKAEEAQKAGAAKPLQAPSTSQPSSSTTAKLELSRSPSPAPATPSRGRGLRLAGLITAGAGVVGLGAGVAFQLRAGSLSDELSKPGAPYDRGKINDGESAERNMTLAYAAGGVLVVGGAALYLLGRRAGSERLAVSPTVSSQGGGLVVSGSWR